MSYSRNFLPTVWVFLCLSLAHCLLFIYFSFSYISQFLSLSLGHYLLFILSQCYSQSQPRSFSSISCLSIYHFCSSISFFIFLHLSLSEFSSYSLGLSISVSLIISVPFSNHFSFFISHFRLQFHLTLLHLFTWCSRVPRIKL
jgi:hypothetical protein